MTPRTRARSDCAKALSCRRLASRLSLSASPRDRQPSEAAYGSSGRAREVGAILRCVLTSYAIAARPHRLVRREHAHESRRDTALAAGRYMPTDPSPQISPSTTCPCATRSATGSARAIAWCLDAQRLRVFAADDRLRPPDTPLVLVSGRISRWPAPAPFDTFASLELREACRDVLERGYGTVRPCDM